ncbi:MAG: ABC transporter permease [Thermoleophilaceae bacterium]|nr:ABC transporter permease [Thermoleophilaceae bacterium]
MPEHTISDPSGAPVVLVPLDAPRTIKGPSAFGGSARRFFALTWMIAVTDFKLTYFGSALGYLWSLFRPLMLFGVYFVVFTQIAPLGDDIKNYGGLLLLNIMLYQFFVEATSASIMAVTNRESMVRKMQFPRLVIPLATVTTSLLNLAVNLVAVLILIALSGVPITWTWLLLPVGVLPLIVLTLSISCILSALFVRFRDIMPIWQVFSTALFYASPILYAIETPPEHLRQFIQFNPLTPIIGQLRHWIIDPTAPTGWDSVGGWPVGLIPIGILLLLPPFAIWYFNREAPKVAERL